MKARLVAALLAFWAGAAFAEGSAVLVSTDPFGAQVLVDGAPVDGLTPLVLRGLSPSVHRIEVRKQGYGPASLELSLRGKAADVATLELVPLFFVASFPEDAEVRVGAGQAADPYLLLPSGEYTVRRGGDALHVEPIYERQRWIDGLDVALPAAIALSGGLALYETTGPGGGDRRVSPLTLSSYVVAALVLVVDLGLRAERDRVRGRFRFESADRTPREAADMMRRADRLVQAGLLDQAVESYQGIVARFPDLPAAAEALFRSARVHRVARQDAAAEAAYQRIVGRYPTAELHDRARMALAELRAAAGDSSGALEHLDRLLFVGGGVSEADAAALRQRLTRAAKPAATPEPPAVAPPEPPRQEPPAAATPTPTPSAPGATPAPLAPGTAPGSP